MKITSLKINNFRNYKKLVLDFNPSKNIIIGKNGMGKTNIVEAIYVLALSKSFRGTKDDVIINYDSDTCKVEGTVVDEYKNDYKIVISKDDNKKVWINKKKIPKLVDYLSNINVVLFTVDDLKLVKDTPNTRRKLINIELSQFSNDYLKITALYNKLLKQRNSYLKTLYLNGNASREYLDIITNKLIEYGIKIFEYRNDFINEISKYISDNYKKITKLDNLKIVYKSDFINKSKEEIIKLYKKNENRDIISGITNIGVHRDDYEFILDEKSLKDYGSEGEQKNAVIALKMAEIEICRDKKNIIPILILDDLFSELDKTKINNILKFIENDIQTFITTTEINKLNKDLKENSKIFIVKDGVVEIKEN